MELTSEDMDDGGRMPEVFTCDGLNTSPRLDIEDVPGGAGSLALVMNDLDAGEAPFYHWIVVGIPPSVGTMRRGWRGEEGQVMRNDFGVAGYVGPCFPDGHHRYRFTLYALDWRPRGHQVSVEELDFLLRHRVLGRCSLTVSYGGDR